MTAGGTRRRAPQRGSWVFRLVVGCSLATLVLVTGALPAGASPQTVLESKVAQAKKIQHTIAAQDRRAEMLDEQYLEAKAAITDAQTEIRKTEASLTAGQARADALRRRLAARAAVLYMNVDASAPAIVEFGINQESGSRTQYGAATQAHDIQLADDVASTALELRHLRGQLKDTQHTARTRQHKAQSALKKLKDATAQQHKLLASVNTDIAGLIREISLQQQTAAELAARAKLAKTFPKLVLGLPIGDVGTDPGTFPAPTLGAAAAVDFARKQIGDPYIYAASGPDTWDCSGLTMVAWAQSGVTMVHNALAQYTMLPKVPLDQIQPGDLVFFGNPIHHVGIYVGGGVMIEAPHTGAFVRYASIFRDDIVLEAARP